MVLILASLEVGRFVWWFFPTCKLCKLHVLLNDDFEKIALWKPSRKLRKSSLESFPFKGHQSKKIQSLPANSSSYHRVTKEISQLPEFVQLPNVPVVFWFFRVALNTKYFLKGLWIYRTKCHARRWCWVEKNDFSKICYKSWPSTFH